MPIEITMPRLSDTMEQGTIIQWNVKEGDSVSAGDVVAEVETDKATMEMQVYDDGVMAKILVDPGQTVEVGELIAVVAEEDEDVSDVASKAGSSGAKKTKSATASEASESDDTTEDAAAATAVAAPPASRPTNEAPAGARRNGVSSNGDDGGRLRISPVARRLAEDHNLDVKTISGSGPKGRIIKRDVLQAIESGDAGAPAAPSPAAPSMPVMGAALRDESKPLSNMRQTIAKRLVESKTSIPHYQVTVRFDVDALMELRRTLNEQLASQGVKLSVNDFLVRACALAMHQHPEFNASFGGDSINYHADVNVGVAIALPAERGGGLVVGTLRHADQAGLRAISAETKRLAEKARSKGLTVEEMSDSTFTISNLGMFGVDHFTAIINPPNAAILAVGGAMEIPVVRDGQIVVGHEMSATLSLDHRVIDGAMAAQYLQTVKHFIEHPATLLV